jgi:serine/threonine protein kinase
MGCSTSTSVIDRIYLSPTNQQTKVRTAYTIKHCETFNSTTGLFHGEQIGNHNESAFVRFSRIPSFAKGKINKRLDILKENEGKLERLVPYFKVEVTSKFLYLVTKPTQSLVRAIISNELVMSEDKLREVFGPLFKTLATMHELEFIHGQITPNKILLLNNASYLFDPCVGSESTTDRISENYLFLSPEDLRGGALSYSSDVWSMGAVLYYFITGNYVFPINKLEVSKEFEPDFTLPVWDLVRSELKNLIKQMLTYNPLKRIKMSQVLNHKWLKVKRLSTNSLLGSAEQITVNHEREICLQRTKYCIANDKSFSAINELQKSFRGVDSRNSGYLEYHAIRRILKHSGACANCDFFWDYQINYHNLIQGTKILNSLIMHERSSVLFDQLGKDRNYLNANEIKTMLCAIAHSECTASCTFESMIRMCQRHQRDDLTLNYEEFLVLCQNLNFVPIEGLVMGSFF